MTTGTGLALLGIWLFVAVCAASREVTGTGLLVAIIAGVLATALVALT